MLLTGHSPRGQTTPERVEEQQVLVKNGIPPTLHKFYRNSNAKAIVAIREAIQRCYEGNPEYRKSARDVANGLLEALVTWEK